MREWRGWKRDEDFLYWYFSSFIFMYMWIIEHWTWIFVNFVPFPSDLMPFSKGSIQRSGGVEDAERGFGEAGTFWKLSSSGIGRENCPRIMPSLNFEWQSSGNKWTLSNLHSSCSTRMRVYRWFQFEKILHPESNHPSNFELLESSMRSGSKGVEG